MERSLFAYGLVTAMLLAVLPVTGFGVTTPSIGQIPTRATVHYVGKDQEFKNISSALNASSDGDTIRVFAGTYDGNFSIDRSLMIIGNGTGDTVIETGYESNSLRVNNTGIVFEGFTFNSTDITYGPFIATNLDERTALIEIKGCQILGSHLIFPSLKSSNPCRIVDCSIIESNVHNFENNHSEFQRVDLIESMLFIWGDENSIGDCLFKDSLLDVEGDRNTLVRNNIEGTQVYISGNNNKIIGNKIFSNRGSDGSFILDGAMNEITFNDFEGFNDFCLISTEIMEMGMNEIYYNNFIDNGNGSSQARDDFDPTSMGNEVGAGSNKWNSSIAGNFWSDLEIRDMDQDFINDIPYRIEGAGNCSDMMPLVKRIVYPFPPIITSKIVQSVMPGSHLSVKFTALDLDTDQSELEWDLKTNASWLSLNEDNYLYGEVPESTGSFWVSISATDGRSMDYSNFTLSIDPSSMYPKITTANVLTCYEDSPYQVDYDAEGPDIEWSLTTDAEFLDMNTSSGYLVGNPDNSDVGKHSITIKAANKWSTASTTFELEVINVNDPPEVISINLTDGELKEGSFQEYTGYADDIDIFDDGKLIFIWSLNDDGEVGNGTTVRLELEPGVHNLTLTVKDPKDASATMSISIDIDEMPDGSKDELIRFITSYGLTAIIVVVIIMIIASLMFIQIRNRRRVAKGREETKGNDLEVHIPTQNELDGPLGKGQRLPSMMVSPEADGAEPLRTGHLESIGRSGLGIAHPDGEMAYIPSPSHEEMLDDLIQEVLEASGDDVQTPDRVKVERRLKTALNDGIISEEEYLEIEQDLNDGPRIVGA